MLACHLSHGVALPDIEFPSTVAPLSLPLHHRILSYLLKWLTPAQTKLTYRLNCYRAAEYIATLRQLLRDHEAKIMAGKEYAKLFALLQKADQAHKAKPEDIHTQVRSEQAHRMHTCDVHAWLPLVLTLCCCCRMQEWIRLLRTSTNECSTNIDLLVNNTSMTHPMEYGKQVAGITLHDVPSSDASNQVHDCSSQWSHACMLTCCVMLTLPRPCTSCSSTNASSLNNTPSYSIVVIGMYVHMA